MGDCIGTQVPNYAWFWLRSFAQFLKIQTFSHMFTILCHGPPVSMLHLLVPSGSVNAWAAASTIARPDPLQRCVGTRHMPRRRTHGRVASGHHRDPGGDQKEFQHGFGFTRPDKSRQITHQFAFKQFHMSKYERTILHALRTMTAHEHLNVQINS